MNAIANIEFQSRIFISGTVTALTGLHIGGSSTEMGIGGADQIVVRDPITNYPYIPGSSLRGKMRSLLERARGEMTIDLRNSPTRQVTSVRELAEPLANGAEIGGARPSSHPDAKATRLFGIAIDQNQGTRPETIVPQRLVVRDARLQNSEALERATNTEMPLTEVKTEVAIDRITSKANPRQIERVPAGAEFGFEMVLSLYGEDDPADFTKLVFQCMELLQDDYLGGHGSRGYGRVQFNVESLTRKTVSDYQSNTAAQPIEDIEIPATLKR